MQGNGSASGKKVIGFKVATVSGEEHVEADHWELVGVVIVLRRGIRAVKVYSLPTLVSMELEYGG